MTQPIRIAIVSGAAIGVAVLVYLVYAFDPATEGFFPRCIFLMVTGFQCPGCGSTRGMHALLHGDIATAWDFNPLMFFVVPLVGVLGVWEGLRFAGVKLKPLKVPSKAIWALVVVAIVFGIARNVM